MSDFVLARNHTHRSTYGHIINFVKGEPTFVPPVCHREVFAIGALPVKDTIDPLGDEVQPKPELTGDERRDQLVAAFKILQERNARGDFTGQGVPSIPALKKLIDDFEPDKPEVVNVWRAYIGDEIAGD